MEEERESGVGMHNSYSFASGERLHFFFLPRLLIKKRGVGQRRGIVVLLAVILGGSVWSQSRGVVLDWQFFAPAVRISPSFASATLQS